MASPERLTVIRSLFCEFYDQELRKLRKTIAQLTPEERNNLDQAVGRRAVQAAQKANEAMIRMMAEQAIPRKKLN